MPIAFTKGMKVWGLIITVLILAGCGSSSSTSNQSKAQTSSSMADTDVAGSVASMGKGDLYYVNFDSSGQATIALGGGASGASYMLLVQSTTTTSSTVSATSSDVSAISADLTSEFDMELREREENLADRNELPSHSVSTTSKSFGKALDETSTFRVLSSITSTSSYTTVTATKRCTKDHMVTYIDNEVSSDTLTASDVETLCDQFEHAAAVDVETFGEPSDVNGDGKLVVLVSPAVNKLGASGGGIITGYFYASDLFAQTSSNSTSNEMEIVYILAPDPDGDYGTAISKEFAMSNLMPAVVPHEFQHAISYNQHVFVNGGTTEKNWLNEGLSHYAEDHAGFGQENPSRMEIFLESPETTRLATISSPNLGERGAGYSFMRFLYEKAEDPAAFLAALENTTNTGETNIETAFAGSDPNFDEWEEFMRRWAIALALTDAGVSSTLQYQFDVRSLDPITGNWQGICMICDADDNRGTMLAGPAASDLSGGTLNVSLSGTATAFYNIASPTSTITLSGKTSAGLQGVLIRMD